MKPWGWSLLWLAMAGCAGRPELPVYGHVPDFQLTAETGQAFDRRALDAKVWVADFIFTHCTGPCPRMSSQMRRVQAAVAGLAEVRLVSFTVDPERDTPSALADYARRFHAQPGRWFFLTGDPATLHSLDCDAFKLGSVDGSMNHSTHFVLVDRHSRIRGYYGTAEEDPTSRLIRDIRQLLKEGS